MSIEAETFAWVQEMKHVRLLGKRQTLRRVIYLSTNPLSIIIIIKIT